MRNLQKSIALISSMIGVVISGDYSRSQITNERRSKIINEDQYGLYNTNWQTFKDCFDCPEMISIDIIVNGAKKRMAVARFELTWKEYLASVEQFSCQGPMETGATKDEKINIIPEIIDNYPITSIYPKDISCYLQWIKDKTGKYYRLPTEAEWEAFASKGRKVGTVLAGDIPSSDEKLLGRYCLECKISERDQRAITRWHLVDPVGTYRPNALGLYDVLGNAAEVVSDPVSPFEGRDGVVWPRVMTKGGDFDSRGNFDLVHEKQYVLSGLINSWVGYRLVYDGVENVN